MFRLEKEHISEKKNNLLSLCSFIVKKRFVDEGDKTFSSVALKGLSRNCIES
jgi:hypothetical protein